MKNAPTSLNIENIQAEKMGTGLGLGIAGFNLASINLSPSDSMLTTH